MSKNIIQLSDATFDQEVLKSTKPVLVDYWAEWCGPCKAIAPFLDAIAEEFADDLVVAKLNIDHNPSIPPRYGVRGIPTLMLFKNGQVAATKVGSLTQVQLAAFVSQNL
ncbi:thioredoxin TrxA [Candidatus Thiothrix anitrata]|uniref:Thioredoxin n=1 Tax=Candidatus Thiothrix anitrata TaxID=2823902 RepID=A0ABX7X6E4_9GAMM|nr:thioredoxin TrxA [Candidatus Thiothrix anitrata]QTR51442.1 thioredoxin TrxA [Candidatus Thiothrix anitrata]